MKLLPSTSQNRAPSPRVEAHLQAVLDADVVALAASDVLGDALEQRLRLLESNIGLGGDHGTWEVALSIGD